MEAGNISSSNTNVSSTSCREGKAPEGEKRNLLSELKGEEKYRLLFNRMVSGFAMCEVIPDSSGTPVDFRFVQVNPAFESLLGINERSVSGKTARDLFPEIAASWIEICGDVALTNNPASFNSYLGRLDKHLEISAFSTVKGEFALILDDITQRVRIEETLRESEQREKTRAAQLAALMEAVPATVLIAHDRECRLITGNIAACVLLRMPPGSNLSKSAPDGERPVHYRIYRNGVETPTDELPVQRAARGEEIRAYEQEFVFSDGSSCTLLGNATPLWDEEGRPCGAVSTFVDITERKTMEKALQESEELFHTLCESAPIGIFKTDRDGKRIYCSPRCREITGMSAVDCQERGWQSQIHPGDREEVLRSEGLFLAAGEPYWLEYRILFPHDETVWIRELASPLKGPAGIVTGYVGTVEEITELRQVRDEVQRSQKLESLGVLAGGIAHDFNNILTTILGNVSLARMQLSDGEKISKRLNEVESAAARAKELSQQLLTFARGGEPVKGVVEIGPLLKEAADFAVQGSPVKCEYLMDDGLSPVEADEGQLRQVVQNLVINAVQSMPDGGTIRVSVREKETKPEYGGFIEISIADTGTGIPDQHLERIFDPYFTTKQQGSGLGLAVCYSIIKKHGGSIKVKSALGKGSTFYVTLPSLGRSSATESKAPGRDEKGPVNVLIMDDEEQVREILQDMLTELGYHSECAENGAVAIDLYRKRKEEGSPFSVAILDLTIPGGMGGKEAIRTMREIDPDVRAVVSSGYSTDPVMANYREYGFREVLGKPYRLQDMERIMQRVLE
jgi:PAS domain S-box-containing protein